MKASLSGIIFLTIIALLGVNSAQAADVADKNRLAVFAFDPLIPGTDNELSAFLPEALMDGLGKYNNIALLEREKLDKVLEEQQLGSSDLTDPETRTRLGRIIGANFMVFGIYTMADGGDVRVDVRIAETETSQVVACDMYGQQDTMEDVVLKFAPTIARALDYFKSHKNSFMNFSCAGS